MGQKTHPFGFRVGVTEGHKSRWYAPKALFAELLVEDYRIREYVDKRLNRTPPFAAVSDIHIERTREARAAAGRMMAPCTPSVGVLRDGQLSTCSVGALQVVDARLSTAQEALCLLGALDYENTIGHDHDHSSYNRHYYHSFNCHNCSCNGSYPYFNHHYHYLQSYNFCYYHLY